MTNRKAREGVVKECTEIVERMRLRKRDCEDTSCTMCCYDAAYNFALEDFGGILKGLLDKKSCNHDWKGSRNEKTKREEMCFKCGKVRVSNQSLSTGGFERDNINKENGVVNEESGLLWRLLGALALLSLITLMVASK